MEQLTETEKRIVALALFSAAMKEGKALFIQIEALTHKLGIEEEFEFYANDWIEYANKNKNGN